MADTRQQGPSPDQLAQQSLMASHGVAQKAAAAHSAALDKLHAGIQGASAPSDREQHLLGLLASMGPGGGDPTAGGGAGPGGDPQAQQQAVWDQFPSTDPQQAQDMLQQADDPEHGLMALVQQAQADRQKFEGMQADILQQIVAMLGSPAGPGAAPAPPASPAIGGDSSVGYS